MLSKDSFTVGNLNVLLSNLQTKDDAYVEKFIRKGGVEKLMSILQEQLNAKGGIVALTMGLVARERVVNCVKAIMNHPVGIEQFIHGDKSNCIRFMLQSAFSMGDPGNLLCNVVDLTAAICLYSLDGHSIVLDAFNQLESWFVSIFDIHKDKSGHEENLGLGASFRFFALVAFADKCL